MILKNVLIVAPHPDDEVLGVGGSIPLLKKRGGRVTVVIVTDGSSVQYAGNLEVSGRKQEEAKLANEILGTDRLLQWDYPDMRMDTVDHYKLNEDIGHLVAEEKFDTVFLPNGDDVNLDHQLIFRSGMVALRPLPQQSVMGIFTYWVNSSTEWGGRTQQTVFCPNFYMDITSTINVKLQAMSRYETELREFPHPRSLEAIRARAISHGSEAGYAYGEAFRMLLWRGGAGDL